VPAERGSPWPGRKGLQVASVSKGPRGLAYSAVLAETGLRPQGSYETVCGNSPLHQ